MWKTALLALIAFGLASPCDVTGIDAYRVLLAHAADSTPAVGALHLLDAEGEELYEVPGVVLETEGSELGDALERLGIHVPEKRPGLLTQLLVWAGLKSPSPPPPSFVTHPSSILRVPDGRVVVACTPGLYCFPGNADVTLHVVDPTGRVTSTGPFNVGYRTAYPLAALGPPDRFGGSVVVITPGWGVGGSPNPQYYAFCDDRPVLVRVENWEGTEIAKNHYGAPNFALGPDLPDLDAAGWRVRLASDDPVTLLEALVWLGGVHLDVHRDPPDWWHEDLAAARVWNEVVTNEWTKKRLRELAASTDPWIAEAARCAMEIQRYP